MSRRRTALIATEPVEIAIGTPAKRTRKIKRKWMTFAVGGATYKVYIVDNYSLKKANNSDDAIEGITLESISEIWIDVEVDASRRIVVLLHELLHGCFSGPGAGTMLPLIFGCKPDKMGDVEEQVATYLGPRLAEALLPYLRIPKAPR